MLPFLFLCFLPKMSEAPATHTHTHTPIRKTNTMFVDAPVWGMCVVLCCAFNSCGISEGISAAFLCPGRTYPPARILPSKCYYNLRNPAYYDHHYDCCVVGAKTEVI